MKSIIEELTGIQKPEEKAVIEIVSNPLNEVKASYDIWCNIAKKVMPSRPITELDSSQTISIADQLYDEALKLANDKMRGISGSEILSFFKRRGRLTKEWSGLYLSAIMNKYYLDELVIDGIKGLAFIGYKLNHGHIRINSDTIDYIGAFASNGMIENYGHIKNWFAEYATGGIFVNDSLVGQEMGSNASGGVYVNNKDLMIDFGNNASGGIFINNGNSFQMGTESLGGLFVNYTCILDFFGHDSLDGIFITKEFPIHDSPFSKKNSITVNKNRLKKNKELRAMLNSLELLTRGNIMNNGLEIRKLAALIESNCTSKYSKKQAAKQ